MQRRVRHTHAAGRKGNAIHRWQKGKPQSAGQESKGQTTGRRCRKEAPDRSLGAPAWSWGGVRTCGKGRSALRPPNTGRFHALETRPHPVSKRARGGAVCVGQEDAVADERRSWKGAGEEKKRITGKPWAMCVHDFISFMLNNIVNALMWYN